MPNARPTRAPKPLPSTPEITTESKPAPASSARKPRGRKALALLVSAGTLLVGLGAAELWCRWFTDMPWLGNSRTLFVPEAFGASAGNRPSSIEHSFGRAVHLDELGFRIDPEYPDPADSSSALLLLGDSVGFGPGVTESETTAGRLRRELEDTRLYNSSMIGYSTHDYANVAEHFLPEHAEVRRAYLLFCLNDVSAESARSIRASLDSPAPQGGAQDAAEVQKPTGFVETLRGTWAGGLNAFLRSRSKLYLVLKDELTDPRRRYFLADRAHYLESGASRFDAGVAPLLRVRAAMEQRGVDWTVVLLPYAAQLRTDPPSELEPQERLARFLEENGIRFIDATRTLAPFGGEAFLRGDPMHLSSRGHAALAELLLADLTNGTGS